MTNAFFSAREKQTRVRDDFFIYRERHRLCVSGVINNFRYMFFHASRLFHNFNIFSHVCYDFIDFLFLKGDLRLWLLRNIHFYGNQLVLSFKIPRVFPEWRSSSGRGEVVQRYRNRH